MYPQCLYHIYPEHSLTGLSKQFRSRKSDLGLHCGLSHFRHLIWKQMDICLIIVGIISKIKGKYRIQYCHHRRPSPALHRPILFHWILYIPVNNFSVISGRIFPNETSTKQRINVFLMDTTQCLRWGSKLQYLDLESSILPLRHTLILAQTVLTFSELCLN